MLWETWLQNRTICHPAITANLKVYTTNKHFDVVTLCCFRTHCKVSLPLCEEENKRHILVSLQMRKLPFTALSQPLISSTGVELFEFFFYCWSLTFPYQSFINFQPKLKICDKSVRGGNDDAGHGNWELTKVLIKVDKKYWSKLTRVLIKVDKSTDKSWQKYL